MWLRFISLACAGWLVACGADQPTAATSGGGAGNSATAGTTSGGSSGGAASGAGTTVSASAGAVNTGNSGAATGGVAGNDARAGAPNAGSAGSGISGTGIERWGVYEITLSGPSSGNPYVDVKLSADFIQGDLHASVPGFWDGGGVYRIRFSPPTTGDWTYLTHSSASELDAKSGSLRVSDPLPGNHGPVEPFETYYLHYADGTRYHQLGTTAYAWVHQSQSLQEQTLKTLASAPFNKIRFTVFPKSYAYNSNEPELFAFAKSGSGFDHTKPDVAFWRRFEGRIQDLRELGIQADIILWHPYDRWGFSRMSDADDDRYLRYCIARFSAYRNVWWSLANEFDLLKDKNMADWDRFFGILQNEDPHHRMRGIHNLSVVYDHTKPWVTHASLQKWDPGNGLKYREQYKKPVIFDECLYEGDIPQGFGHLSGQQMLENFLAGTFTGIYVGHGETYKDPNDVLWWSKGGVLKGESPLRIQFLKELMAAAPPFDELEPAGDFTLAEAGAFYLSYFKTSGSRTIELSGAKSYSVERIDLWERTISAVGTAPPGPYSMSASKADVAFRFTH